MIEELPEDQRTGYRNPETGARIYIKQHYGAVNGKRVAYIVKVEKPNGNKVTIDGDTKYDIVKEEILENNKDKIKTGFWHEQTRQEA